MKSVDLDHLKTLQDLDWTKIKHFYYVAKLGSFTKAARFLNNTQPGLSRQIGLLEKDLNCTLFYRGARGVILTRKGEELFKVMERCFFDMKGFNFNHITMCQEGQKRKIRVVSTNPIISYILRDHLIEFGFLHPEVILEIVGEDYLIDLTLNDIDLAIRPFEPELKNIQQEYLCSIEKKIFASPKYIEKYGEPKDAEDLVNHRIIAAFEPDKYPYADVGWLLRLGKPFGEMHVPVLASNLLEYMIQAAYDGFGIIGGYDEMSLFKTAKLQHILRDIKGPISEVFIMHPNYIQQDDIVIELKNFIIQKMTKKDN